MLRTLQRFTPFALLSLIFIMGVTPVVRAEDAQPVSKSALAVSPAIIEEVLTPGKPTNFTLHVHNTTNFPLPIKTFVRNLTPNSPTMTQAGSERLDASLWFIVDEPDFILQPNQVRTVKGSIQTPADAIPGGHYATIYFQPLVPEEALSPSMAFVNARVGVLAFLIVKGDIEQKAALKNTLQTTGLIQSGPATFRFAVQNTGNVHLMPSGKLTIYDWRNKQVASKEIPAGFILPNETKDYTMTWDNVSGMGTYRAELTLHYGPEQIALPKTTATFWVVPWMKMLIGAVMLVGSAFFILKTRRRWRKAWRALRGKPTHR